MLKETISWKTLSYTTDCHFQQILHCVKSAQMLLFFWFVFSCIWTEYGDLLRKFAPYSVRLLENKDQKKLRISTLFTQF